MPFPKCKTVQENPKTPTRTTKSTQVKLRLISAASSWMEGNFIANGNPEYFRVSFQRQSVSCNSFDDSARLFVEALYLGLMYRELVLENCDGSAGAARLSSPKSSPYRCRVTLPRILNGRASLPASRVLAICPVGIVTLRF